VTRSKKVRVPSKCIPKRLEAPGIPALRPERKRLEEEHELHQRRERQCR